MISLLRVVLKRLEYDWLNTFTGVSYYSPEDNYVKLSYKEMDETVR